MLGELAEVSLAVAKELARRLHASETPEEAETLAGAFHKISRTMRLSLALDAKLEREAARDAQAQAREAETARLEAEARPAVAQPAAAPCASEHPSHAIKAQKSRVRGLLNRLLWNEAEGDSDEYDVLWDDLSARLDEAARDPAFLDLPIERLAGRMVADMGLSGRLTLTVYTPPEPVSAPPSAVSETTDTG
ncbi:MAG: hypothetical protein JSS35_12275 [Proteobacteria bacterium]|nr:hypothetical protein [Pseudomonadota bacterium]